MSGRVWRWRRAAVWRGLEGRTGVVSGRRPASLPAPNEPGANEVPYLDAQSLSGLAAAVSQQWRRLTGRDCLGRESGVSGGHGGIWGPSGPFRTLWGNFRCFWGGSGWGAKPDLLTRLTDIINNNAFITSIILHLSSPINVIDIDRISINISVMSMFYVYPNPAIAIKSINNLAYPDLSIQSIYIKSTLI